MVFSLRFGGIFHIKCWFGAHGIGGDPWGNNLLLIQI
jgi:hypothetical protein